MKKWQQDQLKEFAGKGKKLFHKHNGLWDGVSEISGKAEEWKIVTPITRFEYITDKGRQVVEYGEFEFELQDDNKTLKVFKK